MSAMPKLKKALLNNVAISVPGKKIIVMIAIVCMEALSLCMILLSCCVTTLKDWKRIDQ